MKVDMPLNKQTKQIYLIIIIIIIICLHTVLWFHVFQSNTNYFQTDLFDKVNSWVEELLDSMEE